MALISISDETPIERATMPTPKITIFGPPLAGKSTTLRAFANSQGWETETGNARFTTSGVAARLFRTCKADEHAQAVTYAGAVWSIDDWVPLLQACNALLIVLDSQVERMDANMKHVDFLRRANLNVRACLLFSKSDLSSSLPTKDIRRRLTLYDAPFQDWPGYASTIQVPDTLLAPFDFLTGD